jgi:hypothetical protein
MSFREVRELLGQPTKAEDLPREKGKKDKDRVRWTYVDARRVLLFEDGRLVSITIR